MAKNKLITLISDPVCNVNKSCLQTLTDCLIDSSNDKIVITDSKFRIITSNFSDFYYGENVLKKLKLKKIDFCEKYKRSYLIYGKKFVFEISVSKINTEESGYERFIFILKDITAEEEYRRKLSKLMHFLKHELSTPLISQAMALKLVLKSEKNKNLLPEILHSCETSYRLLKNCIEEVEFDENSLKLNKTNVNLQNFITEFLSSCQKFLLSRNIKIETNIIKKNEIAVDEQLLKKALENILFQINERCDENSKIILKAECSKTNFRFEILAPFEFEEEMFHQTDEKLYTKLAHDNGLFLAERIISAHGGRIIIQQRCDRTSLKIILPNE